MFKIQRTMQTFANPGINFQKVLARAPLKHGSNRSNFSVSITTTTTTTPTKRAQVLGHNNWKTFNGSHAHQRSQRNENNDHRRFYSHRITNDSTILKSKRNTTSIAGSGAGTGVAVSARTIVTGTLLTADAGISPSLSFLSSSTSFASSYSSLQKTRNLSYFSSDLRKSCAMSLINSCELNNHHHNHHDHHNHRNMSTEGSGGGGRCVNVETINPNIVTMEYAVRGPLVIRAGEIERELKEGKKKPFDKVIRCNIGDCHAMGQKPITFIRQVLSLALNPSLCEIGNFPDDVKERALTILKGCGGESLGAYSDSAGIEVIRRQVAEYIKNRDGYDSDWRNIILIAGASTGIKGLLSLLRCEIGGKIPGIMVPIPQYPLYSATLAEYGMHQIGYYLDEDNNWGLDIDELKRAIKEARKVCHPRAIVVINPGNPTGQVLTKENICNLIKFACEEKLVIFADEVYQHNVYDKNSKFHSFKKVLMEMGSPYDKLELASFMSCSKGYMGECGIRGGYMEVINLCPKVMAMFLKSISAQLCPTTVGQATISCVVNPPKKGEPSYELFIKEKNEVLGALKEKAELVYKTFNSFEGFKCNPVQGAMYAFPQITLPPKAIEAAKADGKAPDVFYAFQLLEKTGVCIVPGTGFHQRPGTHHFRTTILPPTDKLKEMLKLFKNFHEDFMKKYN